jgi:hypothetical protein
MPFNLKQSLEVMKKNDKATTSSIYRALICGILHNETDISFGNSNAEVMQETYQEIINACKCKYI